MLIDLSRVRVSGPLSVFAAGFAEHLTQQDYKPRQARKQMWLMNRLSYWLAREGLGVEELHANEVERFQRDRYAAGYSFLLSIRAMQPILGYLRGLGVAPAVSSPPTGLVMSGWRPLIKGFFAAMRLIVGAVMSSACRCGF